MQSNLIGQKILALQEKHKVPVWAFAEVRKEGGWDGWREGEEEGGDCWLTSPLRPSLHRRTLLLVVATGSWLLGKRFTRTKLASWARLVLYREGLVCMLL